MRLDGSRATSSVTFLFESKSRVRLNREKIALDTERRRDGVSSHV